MPMMPLLKPFEPVEMTFTGRSIKSSSRRTWRNSSGRTTACALTSETGIQTIETLEHDDGVIHHSIVSKFPIPGGDDQAALVGGMAVDITELVRAEEAIRESEERFRGLAEAIPQMVYVVTAQGDIEYLSQRWRDFTGLTHADEASMREVIHPDDYSLMNQRWLEAAALASPFEAEIRIRCVIRRLIPLVPDAGSADSRR